MLEVNAKNDADAVGGEPVFLPNGTLAGRVTSGAYSYTTKKSLALCMIKTSFAIPGSEFNVAIIGQDHEAVMLKTPPFDPTGIRLRS